LPCGNEWAMRLGRRRCLHTWIFLVIAMGTGWSQANGGEPPADGDVLSPILQADSGSGSAPIAVDGALSSGWGRWSSQPPPSSSRSYFLARISGSEGVESNPSYTSGDSSETSSVTSLTGNLSLIKSQRHSETSIDYLANDTLYSSYGGLGYYNQPLQQLDADERIQWSRWQLTFKDAFNYSSQGNFGAPSLTGSASTGDGDGLPNTGVSDFFGASQLGEIGQPGYITNTSAVDVTRSLTPRSSASLAGAYSITNYLGNDEGLFNSREVAAQGGYIYQITRKDGIGVVYGYQSFSFPGSGFGNEVSNSVQLSYQRRITGRMNLTLGVGPELITLSSGVSRQRQITATIQASLGYRWKRSSLNFAYNRLMTGGSGYFAGGISNIVIFSLSRNIFRSWGTVLNGGYAKVSGIGLTSAEILGSSYQYWFTGVVVQRRLGRSLTAFASYQFNDENYGCGGSVSCMPAVHPQVALIGFSWSIRPVRLE
jgi:hypothetical protein